MITSNDISILIVTRVNNHERLRCVYDNIRSFYPTNEIVIIYDGVDHSLGVSDLNLKEVSTKERVYVSGGYNLALKLASNPCFVFLHDDTFIHREFINNLIPHLNENTICNFTTVEPPMFGNKDTFKRPIQNFGFDLEDLDLDSFSDFCDNRNSNITQKTVDNPYGGFFMAGYVNTLLSIGGFDEQFKPFFYEDSDIMIRLHLNGIKFVQVMDSMVYHLVSLTSRKSEDGEYALKETERIFLKKWKMPFHIFKEYTMKNGNDYKKVSVRIDVKNANNELKNMLNLFSDEEYGDHSSVLYVDGSQFTEEDLNYICLLPYIIVQNVKGTKTTFELNNMILEISPESILQPQIIANTL